jgi:hypothetical protein
MSSLKDSVHLFIESYLSMVIGDEAEAFVGEFETQLENGELSHNVKTAIKQIENLGETGWSIYYMLQLYDSIEEIEW